MSYKGELKSTTPPPTPIPIPTKVPDRQVRWYYPSMLLEGPLPVLYSTVDRPQAEPTHHQTKAGWVQWAAALLAHPHLEGAGGPYSGRSRGYAPSSTSVIEHIITVSLNTLNVSVSFKKNSFRATVGLVGGGFALVSPEDRFRCF